MKILVLGINGWYIYHFWRLLLLDLYQKGYKITIVVQHDEYVEKLAGLGFNVEEVNFHSQSINPLKNLISLIHVLKIYKKISPDIVHHFNPKPVIFGTLVARFLNIKKIINNYPGLGNLFRRDKAKYRYLYFFVSMMYRLINSSNRIISIFQVDSDINFFLKKKLIGKSNPILIKSSGVDINKFKLKNKFNLDSHLRVGMISRLNYDKGLDIYFDVASRLKNSNISFFMAGQIENEMNGNKESFSSIALDNNVKYLGFIENIHDFLSSIDVIILPTRRHEGIPKILIESGSCGISTIATNMGGCKDVIIDNETGFLIQNHDVSNSISNHLENLNNNRNLLEKFGLKSRCFIEKNFSINLIIKKYIDVYTNIESNF